MPTPLPTLSVGLNSCASCGEDSSEGMAHGVADCCCLVHYASIMLMIACLVGEHLFLKQELAMTEARTIQRLDIVYGVSATVVLISGVMRMFLEKGIAYYNQHIGFHILVGIFVITALLSIYPTVIFLRWRSDTRAGQGQKLMREQFKKMQMIIRVEMTLLILAPFFATWMAHGEF
jgi:putative membrane protein